LKNINKKKIRLINDKHKYHAKAETVPVEITLEVIECGKKRVINDPTWRGESWVPASEHFAKTHQILYHNRSSKHIHTLTQYTSYEPNWI